MQANQPMNLHQFLAQWHDASATVPVHTSGSTGAPKPMLASKRRMLASARITCDFLGLQPGQNALLCLPLDYIAGKMMVVRSIERGLNLVSVEPGGHPLAHVGQHIHFAAMVPLQVANSLAVPCERERLMAIDQLIIGGGAVDDGLARELRGFPNAVWSTYGMTETLSHIALRRLSGPAASAAYTPFAGVQVGLDGRGCLTIAAPEVCPTRLVTNDCATIHPDGTFTIGGRIDNVIDTGGIKVQAEQLERLLAPHLAAPFVVTHCPHRSLGQMIVLLTQDPDTQAVQQLCNQAVANPYHRPRQVLHVPRIPTTATGKPARASAAQLALQLQQS